MKRFLNILAIGSVSLCMAFAPALEAAAAERGNNNHRTENRGNNHRTSTGATNNRPTQNQRPNNNNGNRPGGGNQQNGNRPGGGNQQNGNRPGGGNQQNGNRPNNGGNRPGGGNQPGGQPGGQPGRPGQGSIPGGPGHGGPGMNPGHGHAPGHGNNWGWNGHVPHGRPGWAMPMPPRPPRPHRPIVVGVPTISSILGLTFGSFINYGLSSLIGAGYTVVNAYDNAIYLSNVPQMGIVWPQVTMYYGNAGMNGAAFRYVDRRPSWNNYNTVYNQLMMLYGAPINTTVTNGVMSATWWGGNNSGYVTLSYGPASGPGGLMYYTDLVYGN